MNDAVGKLNGNLFNQYNNGGGSSGGGTCTSRSVLDKMQQQTVDPAHHDHHVDVSSCSTEDGDYGNNNNHLRPGMAKMFTADDALQILSQSVGQMVYDTEDDGNGGEGGEGSNDDEAVVEDEDDDDDDDDDDLDMSDILGFGPPPPTAVEAMPTIAPVTLNIRMTTSSANNDDDDIEGEEDEKKGDNSNDSNIFTAEQALQMFNESVNCMGIDSGEMSDNSDISIELGVEEELDEKQSSPTKKKSLVDDMPELPASLGEWQGISASIKNRMASRDEDSDDDSDSDYSSSYSDGDDDEHSTLDESTHKMLEMMNESMSSLVMMNESMHRSEALWNTEAEVTKTRRPKADDIIREAKVILASKRTSNSTGPGLSEGIKQKMTLRQQAEKNKDVWDYESSSSSDEEDSHSLAHHVSKALAQQQNGNNSRPGGTTRPGLVRSASMTNMMLSSTSRTNEAKKNTLLVNNNDESSTNDDDHDDNIHHGKQQLDGANIRREMVKIESNRSLTSSLKEQFQVFATSSTPGMTQQHQIKSSTVKARGPPSRSRPGLIRSSSMTNMMALSTSRTNEAKKNRLLFANNDESNIEDDGDDVNTGLPQGRNQTGENSRSQVAKIESSCSPTSTAMKEQFRELATVTSSGSKQKQELSSTGRPSTCDSNDEDDDGPQTTMNQLPSKLSVTTDITSETTQTKLGVRPRRSRRMSYCCGDRPAEAPQSSLLSPSSNSQCSTEEQQTSQSHAKNNDSDSDSDDDAKAAMNQLPSQLSVPANKISRTNSAKLGARPRRGRRMSYCCGEAPSEESQSTKSCKLLNKGKTTKKENNDSDSDSGDDTNSTMNQLPSKLSMTPNNTSETAQTKLGARPRRSKRMSYHSGDKPAETPQGSLLIESSSSQSTKSCDSSGEGKPTHKKNNDSDSDDDDDDPQTTMNQLPSKLSVTAAKTSETTQTKLGARPRRSRRMSYCCGDKPAEAPQSSLLSPFNSSLHSTEEQTSQSHAKKNGNDSDSEDDTQVKLNLLPSKLSVSANKSSGTTQTKLGARPRRSRRMSFQSGDPPPETPQSSFLSSGQSMKSCDTSEELTHQSHSKKTNDSDSDSDGDDDAKAAMNQLPSKLSGAAKKPSETKLGTRPRRSRRMSYHSGDKPAEAPQSSLLGASSSSQRTKSNGKSTKSNTKEDNDSDSDDNEPVTLNQLPSKLSSAANNNAGALRARRGRRMSSYSPTDKPERIPIVSSSVRSMRTCDSSSDKPQSSPLVSSSCRGTRTCDLSAEETESHPNRSNIRGRIRSASLTNKSRSSTARTNLVNKNKLLFNNDSDNEDDEKNEDTLISLMQHPSKSSSNGNSGSDLSSPPTTSSKGGDAMRDFIRKNSTSKPGVGRTSNRHSYNRKNSSSSTKSGGSSGDEDNGRRGLSNKRSVASKKMQSM